jgi:hypothetical protein
MLGAVLAGDAGEQSVALDRAGITAFRDTTFLAASPVSIITSSAAQRGASMNEAEWLSCTDSAPMLDNLRGKATDRQLRRFAGVLPGRLADAHGSP